MFNFEAIKAYDETQINKKVMQNGQWVEEKTEISIVGYPDMITLENGDRKPALGAPYIANGLVEEFINCKKSEPGHAVVTYSIDTSEG